MTLSIATHAALLVSLTAVTAQFLPRSYPYFPQSPIPVPNHPLMQMPQIPHLPPMHLSPMPFQLPYQMPHQMPPRVPMVMMHHHQKRSEKKPYKKRKRIRIHSSSEESSDEADSRVRNKMTRRSRKHQVLTPVVSYVTKDGYVVYQKKIKKERAKDWLEMGKERNRQERDEMED